MICAKCGREMPDTDRYCGICGTLNQLFDAPPPVQETDAQAGVLPVQEPAATQTGDVTAQENTDTQASDLPVTEAPDLPVPDFAAGIHSSVARVQGSAPQPGVTPPPGYRPYPAVEPPAPKEKVKRTCSLSVAIFCGIVIFLLSVLCGIFAGLYFSVKPAAVTAPHSVTEYTELPW